MFSLNILLVSFMFAVVPLIDRTTLTFNPKVIINRTVVINCPVTGIPIPEITWLKNGDHFDPLFHPNMQILAGGQQQRFTSAAVSDTATYRCLATNKAGKDSVEFHLVVQSKRTLFILEKILYHNGKQKYHALLFV